MDGEARPRRANIANNQIEEVNVEEFQIAFRKESAKHHQE